MSIVNMSCEQLPKQRLKCSFYFYFTEINIFHHLANITFQNFVSISALQLYKNKLISKKVEKMLSFDLLDVASFFFVFC